MFWIVIAVEVARRLAADDARPRLTADGVSKVEANRRPLNAGDSVERLAIDQRREVAAVLETLAATPGDALFENVLHPVAVDPGAGRRPVRRSRAAVFGLAPIPDPADGQTARHEPFMLRADAL
jgi:hypothetical protein